MFWCCATLSVCVLCCVSLCCVLVVCVLCCVLSLCVCLCCCVCCSVCHTCAPVLLCLHEYLLLGAQAWHTILKQYSAGIVMLMHQAKMRAQLAVANSCSDKILFTFLINVTIHYPLLLLPHALVLLLVVCMTEGTRTFLCEQPVSVYLCVNGMGKHYPVVFSYYSICTLLVLCVLFSCCVCTVLHIIVCCVCCVCYCVSLSVCRAACAPCGLACRPCPLPYQRYDGTHCRTLILFNNLSR